jgi:hypothetical protein
MSRNSEIVRSADGEICLRQVKYFPSENVKFACGEL